MTILRDKGLTFTRGYHIEISGNIPLNAGLSSSSALVVAWIRFLISTQTEISFTDAEIGHLAYEAEVGFFKQPGGLMDQYAIAQQGLLFIDTTTGKTEQLKGTLGNLVVAESGIEKQTQDVLKNARIFQENAIQEVWNNHPDFEIQKATPVEYERYRNLISEKYQPYWHAAIFNLHITKRAKDYLNKPNSDIRELSYLMNQHQAILENQIGNTPIAMQEMMFNARNAGALATKTIGSGGGGSIVALVDLSKIEDVKNAFIKTGAKDAYEVQLTYPER
nr:GHMP kinase [Croceivirga thetidis]